MSAPATLAPPARYSPDTTGDIDELIRSHLPLVGHLVRELLGKLPSHISRDELTSAGMMALVTSAQGFDASRGVPFGRFATIRIRGALTDELRSMDWASRSVRSKARELASARHQLTGALGRVPRREEIAQVLGVSMDDIDTIEADVQRAATLSVEGLRDEGGSDLMPSPNEGPEGLLVRREQIGLLHDAIAELPDRLRIVVEQYFYGQRRMADIAADLGVTESRVSQLRSEALGMLRDGLRGQELAGSAERSASAGGGVTDRVPRLAAAGTGATTADSRSGVRVPDAMAAGTPRKRAAARQAYVAAVASRSTLATRLAATTVLGETHAATVEGLRAAQ